MNIFTREKTKQHVGTMIKSPYKMTQSFLALYTSKTCYDEKKIIKIAI
jgi:hypothetical protein